MNATYGFLIWQYGAPVITLTPTLDFSVWLYGAPVIEIDESYGVLRRRFFIM